MTLDEDIVEWHKKTFPDITMGELLLKLEEELGELECALGKTDSSFLEEAADVYIVSRALIERFCSKIGMTICDNITKLDECDSIMDAVKDKLSKNKKRKWHKVDGVYRHKEEE